MGKIRAFFGQRSQLDVQDTAGTPTVQPEPPAATSEGVAAASDLHAKRRIWINIPMQPPYVDADTGYPVITYPGNKVRTSKYTVVTFVPKNLIEQFRSVANFYFTSLVVLQCFPPFMQVSPVMTAAPIVFIIVATALKDAIEDWRRHRADAGVNKAPAYVLSNWNNTNHADSTKLTIKAMLKRLRRTASRAMQGCFRSVMLTLYPPLKKRVNKSMHASRPALIAADDYMQDDIQIEDLEQGNTIKATEGAGGNNVTSNAPKTSYHSASHSVWKLANWEDVRVGDFIFLRNNDPIPADMMIISTSEPDSVCYVETKNLDGETNLKVRRGVNELADVKTPEDCQKIRAYLDSEPPSVNLYSYSGALSILPLSEGRRSTSESDTYPQRPMSPHAVAGATIVPITVNGILLRGCVMRNTKWAIGIALFTGADSKIMLNSGATPSKRSRIDRQINPQVLVNFMLLCTLCVVCAVIAAIYQSTHIYEGAMWAGIGIIGEADRRSEGMETPSGTAFVTFFMAMIIFQNIIPIALVISIEIAKLFQSFMIHVDDEMYDPESETHCSPRSWNLCDDLGQIEYIFSDKTGTLTCNTMEFRKCTINGVVYGGSFVTEAMQGAAERVGEDTDFEASNAKRAVAEKDMIAGMAELFDTKYVSSPLSFVDADLPRHLKENDLQARRIREFFTLLAICHTVLVERPDRGDPNFLEYKAQSPDEAALVAAARDVGFAFLKRTDNKVLVDLMGQQRTYTILHFLEFNSDRKRMSVIIQRPEGDVILLCKGADSVIYDRLSPTNDLELMDVTSAHLESFANEGLRTLCLAYRVIPLEIYEGWAERYRNAQALIVDREKHVDIVAETIEKELVLMGATAIEDKLQDGVPDTIALLAKAGIKIWVLTGDKMETAINIGFACNLLTRNMVLIVVKSVDVEETFRQLTEALERFWDSGGAVRNDAATGESTGDCHALIIDGESLKHALEPKCKALLLELGCRCRAVICCRVSPLQKAMVVRLVRKGLGAMCLSIGDGANDVSMIQEADVGIGIAGKEGLQAVMASDYAIGQFRFLQRLLIVHGRWAYMRTAELVLNYFYKNVVYLFVVFWFQFDCGFSASLNMDYTYSMFYNTFFTLLPTIAIGTLDQDVDDVTSMRLPQLYRKGIRQTLYNMDRFWAYMFDGIYQSVVIYYVGYFLFKDAILYRQGWSATKDDMGTLQAFSIIVAVNLYAAMSIRNWTFIMHLALLISLLIWVIYLVIYVGVKSNPTYGQLDVLLRSGTFWLALILSVTLALAPRFIADSFRWFRPDDTAVGREIMKYGSQGRVTEAAGTVVEAPSEARDSYSRRRQPAVVEEEEAEVKVIETSEPTRLDVVQDSNIRRNFSDNILSSHQKPTGTSAEAEGRASSSGMRRAVSAQIRTGAEMTVTPAIVDPLHVVGHGRHPETRRPGHRHQPSSDGFGDEPPHRQRKFHGEGEGGPSGSPRASATSQSMQSEDYSTDRSRRSSLFRPRNISAAVKGAGKKIGSVVQRFRDRTHASRLGSHGRTGSVVVFMGGRGEPGVINTGFAFSHAEGMECIITPTRSNIPDISAPPYDAHGPAGASSSRNVTPSGSLTRNKAPVMQRLVSALRPGHGHHHAPPQHVHFAEKGEEAGDPLGVAVVASSSGPLTHEPTPEERLAVDAPGSADRTPTPVITDRPIISSPSEGMMLSTSDTSIPPASEGAAGDATEVAAGSHSEQKESTRTMGEESSGSRV
ncbi:hypothetical protein BC832DRAFT_88201 [Gaertneriomyces semiglobifer]|nr:hypothetical protein BC832DRAFT_88201 [Gaertneriomyces semiglobifer]